jgi:hypothetical protein
MKEIGAYYIICAGHFKSRLQANVNMAHAKCFARTPWEKSLHYIFVTFLFQTARSEGKKQINHSKTAYGK